MISETIRPIPAQVLIHIMYQILSQYTQYVIIYWLHHL